jgi:hypothetical protein
MDVLYSDLLLTFAAMAVKRWGLDMRSPYSRTVELSELLIPAGFRFPIVCEW